MARPAYSPDFNPIENLWDALRRAIFSCFLPPALQEEWRLPSSAMVDHLIESIVTKCQLCMQVRAEGEGSHPLLMSFFSFYFVLFFSPYT